MITAERRAEILSMDLESLSRYYVKLPITFTDYFLVKNFRDDRDNKLIRFLLEKREECKDNQVRYDSYTLLIDTIECYIHARLIGRIDDARKFMFCIICIVTSRKSVV